MYTALIIVAIFAMVLGVPAVLLSTTLWLRTWSRLGCPR
jgi:hypothetical protein